MLTLAIVRPSLVHVAFADLTFVELAVRCEPADKKHMKISDFIFKLSAWYYVNIKEKH